MTRHKGRHNGDRRTMVLFHSTSILRDAGNPERSGFVTDDAGGVHCVNAETGEGYWVHQVGRSIWSSVLGAEGRMLCRGTQWGFCHSGCGKRKKNCFPPAFPMRYTALHSRQWRVVYTHPLPAVCNQDTISQRYTWMNKRHEPGGPRRRDGTGRVGLLHMVCCLQRSFTT